MLAPAHVGHLAMLRSLIRNNAAEGSFDRDLANDSPQAVEFFGRLKRALVTGYFVEDDPATGRVATVAVPGYVFWPEGRHTGSAPVGFGLFRSIDAGAFELWLAGLDLGHRGNGHGRALLKALFATPQGKQTWVVRIPRGSRYIATVRHVLGDLGFDLVGDTSRLCVFVHRDTPAALATRLRGAVQAQAIKGLGKPN